MRIQWKAGVLGCALGFLAAASTAMAEPPGGVESAPPQECCDSCAAYRDTCLANCLVNPYPFCESNCQKGMTYCRYSCGCA